MSDTEESTDTGDSTGAAATPRRRSNRDPARLARRYGPIVAVVVLAVAAVAVFGGGDDGGSDDDGLPAREAVTGDELIRSGPMTPQKAELLGEEVDFGPNCDTEIGRIKLPTPDAPACVEPFSGDNGGPTSTGVTADEVFIVNYEADPGAEPLRTAEVNAAGAPIDTDAIHQSFENYVRLYSQLFETYGRTVRFERYEGTGPADDQAAAQADAIAIAGMEPFAVIDGPDEALPMFATELATRGVICGQGCADNLSDSLIDELYPFAWPGTPTPNQIAALSAEAIGKLAGPGPATLAGDPELQEQDRVYGTVSLAGDDETADESRDAFLDALADHGIEPAVNHVFDLEHANAQDNARTTIAKMEEAGVTTVILMSDPFTPGSLTNEATAQEYLPEWILGPSVLADTTVFGRTFDGQQWKNGFGVSTLTARGGPETYDAVHIHRWAFGEDPPDRIALTWESQLRFIFSAIHLAGPELTPDTFRDGLYRYEPPEAGPTVAYSSRGDHDIWDDPDHGGADDITLIWWDPEATGEDEIGNEGTGMYRYANGGQRYTLDELPGSFEEAGLFDEASSVTMYDELPPEDQPRDYPPPDV